MILLRKLMFIKKKKKKVLELLFSFVARLWVTEKTNQGRNSSWHELSLVLEILN